MQGLNIHIFTDERSLAPLIFNERANTLLNPSYPYAPPLFLCGILNALMIESLTF